MAELGFYQPADARVRYTPCASGRSLPAVVGERLVGIGHAMRVLTLAHGGAAVFGSLHQLSCEAMRHGLLAARGGGFDDPAHRKSLAAVRAHFDRHLVGGAADSAGLDLNH